MVFSPEEGGRKRKNISKHVFLRGTHTERRFLIKSKTSLFSSSVRDKFPRREIQGKREARDGKYIASDKSVFLLPPPPPLRHTEKREKEVKGEGKFCSIVALFSFSLCFSLRAKVNSFETKNQENLMYRIEKFWFPPFFQTWSNLLIKIFFSDFPFPPFFRHLISCWIELFTGQERRIVWLVGGEEGGIYEWEPRGIFFLAADARSEYTKRCTQPTEIILFCEIRNLKGFVFWAKRTLFWLSKSCFLY